MNYCSAAARPAIWGVQPRLTEPSIFLSLRLGTSGPEVLSCTRQKTVKSRLPSGNKWQVLSNNLNGVEVACDKFRVKYVSESVMNIVSIGRIRHVFLEYEV